jgi:arylformamidase
LISSPIIDISMPLSETTPVWPERPKLEASSHLSLADRDIANATLLRMDAHCGTHVDAPLHFDDAGSAIDELGLGPLVGPAWVADVFGHGKIDGALLESAAIPAGTERLLLRTDNSFGHRLAPFREDFVALTADAAQWVVERGMALVGIDYLSIQRFTDGPETHTILLGVGTAILEGLDLSGASQGPWTLVCLPINVVGAEAAPARAVLVHPAGDE